MTTFLGAGYSTWWADTANSVFGQFKGHNSGVPGGIRLVIELGRVSDRAQGALTKCTHRVKHVKGFPLKSGCETNQKR